MEIHSPASPIDPKNPIFRGKFCGNRYIRPEFLSSLTHSHLNEKSFKDYIGSVYFNEIEAFNDNLQAIYLDYMYHNYEFSLLQGYTLGKISCFLEISSKIFHESFTNRLTYDKSFELFRDIIVQHSLFRPPHSILVFNLEEIKLITDHFLSTFYKHFSLYSLAFTPIINMQIITFEMFKTRFPISLNLDDLTIKTINKNDYEILREYLVDKETGLTKEEEEEIMKGDSIHHVPMKKREEWMAMKAEREQKEKIERVMKKEIERLYAKLEENIREQDEEFLSKVNDFKAGKKK